MSSPNDDKRQYLIGMLAPTDFHPPTDGKLTQA
jgi:hypothetical protein